jgi:plastocyanin
MIGISALVIGATVVAVVVAGCSSAVGAPADTSAPRSSPPASMTAGGPSASAPGSSGAPAASGPPTSAAPDPTGSTAQVGATVRISAQNIQFDTNQLAAPAGRAWVLEFANNDAGVPHNVEILDASGASVFKGQIVTGPTTISYQVPALVAGTYTFLCDVHPTMTGVLRVA